MAVVDNMAKLIKMAVVTSQLYTCQFLCRQTGA